MLAFVLFLGSPKNFHFPFFAFAFLWPPSYMSMPMRSIAFFVGWLVGWLCCVRLCMHVCLYVCVCVGIPPKKVHCYTLNILLFYITFFGAACCWFSSSSSSIGYIQTNICTYDVCMYAEYVVIYSHCVVFLFLALL